MISLNQHTAGTLLVACVFVQFGCEKADKPPPHGEEPPTTTADPPRSAPIDDVQMALWKLSRRPSDRTALVEFCEARFDSPDPDVRAAVAGPMAQHYASQLANGDVQAKVPLQRAIGVLFASPSATAEQLGAAAGWVERADEIAQARALWDRIKNRFVDASSTSHEEAADLVRRANLRLGMLGHELTLAGPLARGGQLEWASYRGKVVLVDFWATWCRPCLAEMPHLKKLYDKYHARGFEIVGISLDSDRENETAADTVRLLLDDRDYRWKSVVFSDLNEQGMENPLAKKYGIGGIPRGVLVGRDGRVISINAVGSRLDKLLADQFKEESAP